jgi:D-alanyl-D-alanine carboxypeptidase
LLLDATSGEVLAQDGADVPRYPASLTKLMTLDLAFQALRAGRITLDTPIPVSGHATSVEPVKLGLFPGETLTVRQAILAMTTMSANDAATALGEYLGSGSEVRCAALMTARAHQLGMAQTQFYNASGLPNPGQVTTARDLAVLARDIVVNFPEDQQFFEVQEFDFNGHAVYSNNHMLKTYPGATGMKTGYTTLAEHNLVTSAVRGGHVLIGVELHEPSWGATYQQMTAMLDNGFAGRYVATSSAVANAVPVAEMPQAAPPAVHPSPVRVASAARPVVPHVTFTKPARKPAARVALASAPRWTAQLGIFARMSKARIEAVAVKQMRGVGVARIARVEQHGRILWTAQLAGLTLDAAHDTCDALAARGDSCRVIGPYADHLAMENAANKSGA